MNIVHNVNVDIVKDDDVGVGTGGGIIDDIAKDDTIVGGGDFDVSFDVQKGMRSESVRRGTFN